MNKIGSLSTIEPDKIHQRAKLFQGIEPASVESHRAEREARIRDAFAMPINASRHDHVIPGLAGGDGEFEPMRNEIPIFRDKEHELSAPTGINGPCGIRSDV
jgi:hypothetical protein